MWLCIIIFVVFVYLLIVNSESNRNYDSNEENYNG